MFDGKRVLALIPARGGSKGLPRKNILPLQGRPLIAWSIRAALECDLVDYVLVSTDDKEIRDRAIEHGARAPFLRPPELATDTATTMEVIVHALEWLEKAGNRFDYLLLLQPTSPLRTSTHISSAFALLREKNGTGIVSVCEVDHHPAWTNTLPADHCMAGFLAADVRNVPRQQLPTCYRLNGALYLSEIAALKQEQGFVGPGTYALVMDRADSVDIDDQLDFDLAALLLQRREKASG